MPGTKKKVDFGFEPRKTKKLAQVDSDKPGIHRVSQIQCIFLRGCSLSPENYKGKYLF